MKALICYHSSSGNTRLMCQFTSQKLSPVAVDLFDIAGEEHLPDLDAYAVIGFATWTYYMGLPPRFAAFLQSLPDMAGKPVFLLTSFGMMPGWTLRHLEQALEKKGCSILGGAALHMPENYPPLIIKSMDSPHAPEPKELQAFDGFLEALKRKLEALNDGKTPAKSPIPFDWLNYLIRPGSVQKARQDMGRLAVNLERCEGCRSCQKACLYQAIHYDTRHPVFDENRCHACYACFNHCPKQAIYTTKIRGKGQYSGPSLELQQKLTITETNRSVEPGDSLAK